MGNTHPVKQAIKRQHCMTPGLSLGLRPIALCRGVGAAALLVVLGGWHLPPALAQSEIPPFPVDSLEFDGEIPLEEDQIPPNFPDATEIESQVEELDTVPNPDLEDFPNPDLEDFPNPADVDGADIQPEEGIFPPRFPQQTEEDEEAAEEEPSEDEFPPNPLELTEPDPLLPNPAVDRPLSPLELYYLRQALDALNLEAQAQLAAGNRPQAFEIWYRELRLRRVLGYEEEVPALGRVGEYAWSEGNSEAVQLITARLEEIEQDLQQQEPLNFTLLLSIADSYQVLRNYNAAVRLYEQILVQARETGDVAVEESTLMSLADLHLGWFYFDRAAAVYEELLEKARQRGDRVREQDILTQLAYAYQQGENYEQAINVLQQLVEGYRETEPLRLPSLQIALGNSYRQVEQPGRAANAYQSAYAAALAQQQLGYASDALRQLADLYEFLGRPNDALVVYRLLQSVQLESYDRFGIMEAFSRMGRIYKDQGQTGAAIASYQQALQLAIQMDYPGRVEYFQAQLTALNSPPLATPSLQGEPFDGLIPYEPGDLVVPGMGDRPESSVTVPEAEGVAIPVELEGSEVPADLPPQGPSMQERFVPFGPP